ncbi:RDD family protein [Flavobacterium sinopsychrotolerans]|uniref:RDD family protein n=1 Tax=Flavobacterium sinopsychrotolerans TaxID=604089 RepID=A0A1H8IWV0_9FLAO|nr:RDD family protein [Flavobacterium sinopsychrotolerans]SEN73240.1 RDD family protein [Flavobacterium sinopsychrotolerans]
MENKKFTVTDDLLASKGQRLLNFVIDLFIIYVIEISIGTTIILIGDLTKSDTASNWVSSLRGVESFFFGLVILFFYYLITEMYFSRTFGKYFTKTIVVKHEGSRPNMKSIIVRTLSRLIPFEPFSFLTADRGWHDTLSVTYVVKKHDFIAKKKLFSEE